MVSFFWHRVRDSVNRSRIWDESSKTSITPDMNGEVFDDSGILELS